MSIYFLQGAPLHSTFRHEIGTETRLTSTCTKGYNIYVQINPVYHNKMVRNYGETDDDMLKQQHYAL